MQPRTFLKNPRNFLSQPRTFLREISAFNCLYTEARFEPRISLLQLLLPIIFFQKIFLFPNLDCPNLASISFDICLISEKISFSKKKNWNFSTSEQPVFSKETLPMRNFDHFSLSNIIFHLQLDLPSCC